MRYAIYTRSRPGDIDCKADQIQYSHCRDFAGRFHLGSFLPQYSDTLKVSDGGAVNGMENLFDDIRSGHIHGVIVEDISLLSRRSWQLVKIIDFFAAHQTRILVVKETIPCPIQ